jgi:hypothetical protein
MQNAPKNYQFYPMEQFSSRGCKAEPNTKIELDSRYKKLDFSISEAKV